MSVDLEAYDRLCQARSGARESLSQVIKRAIWLPRGGTAGSLLELTGSLNNVEGKLSDEELDRLDQNQLDNEPAPNRWEEEVGGGETGAS